MYIRLVEPSKGIGCLVQGDLKGLSSILELLEVAALTFSLLVEGIDWVDLTVGVVGADIISQQ